MRLQIVTNMRLQIVELIINETSFIRIAPELFFIRIIGDREHFL